MGPGVSIRYAARDRKRQTIPWVEYRDGKSAEARTYIAAGTTTESAAALPRFEMQCADCHNRIAHVYEAPDLAIDRALAEGRIPASLPFAKKTGAGLLQSEYRSQAEAEAKIRTAWTAYYQQNQPEVFAKRKNEIDAAASTLAGIYRLNVFPDLKVNWTTYPDNLGHANDAGCFRCHDGGHSTSGGEPKTITQGCDVCHQVLAVEEAAPEILKTLGLRN